MVSFRNRDSAPGNAERPRGFSAGFQTSDTVSTTCSTVTRVSEPLASAQRHQRTWQVAMVQAVNRIKVNIPGVVYVTVRSMNNGARRASTGSNNSNRILVHASGDREPVLQSVCTSVTKAGTLSVDFRPSNQLSDRPAGLFRRSKSVEGHLLVEIELPRPYEINAVDCDSQCDVVVEDRVLTNTTGQNSQVTGANDALAVVKLTANHSGRLFVLSGSTTQVILPNLSLTTTGSGQIHLRFEHSLQVTKKLIVNQSHNSRIGVRTRRFECAAMHTNVAGACSFRLFTDEINVDVCKVHMAGTGNVHFGRYPETLSASRVEADRKELSRSLKPQDSTVELRRHYKYNKDASVSGSIHQLKVALIKAAELDTADICVEHADLSVQGHGRVVIRASQSLNATCKRKGIVEYLGTPPESVSKAGNVIPMNVRVQGRRSQSITESIASEIDIPTKESAFERKGELELPTGGVGRAVRVFTG